LCSSNPLFTSPDEELGELSLLLLRRLKDEAAEERIAEPLLILISFVGGISSD
jgi:hypothetical protein